MFTEKTDGADHINVYSKAKTELGRFLSNFAHTPIETKDGHFESIEGYWYWLSCHDDNLRNLYGWAAKDYGRKVRAADWVDTPEFRESIKAAIKTKLENNPEMLKRLQYCDLPLDHYYVFSGKINRPTNGRWIIEFLESFKVPQ